MFISGYNSMRMSITSQASSITSQFKPLNIPIIYVLLITAAELVTSHFLYAGILIHICLLGALLVHSVILDDQKVADLLTAMAVAPLVRILGLSTPLVHFSQITWFAIVSIPMFMAGIAIARLQGLSIKDINFSPPKKKYTLIELVVILICFPIGFLEYHLLRPSGITELNFYSMLAPMLIMMVNTGFLEEFIFRGLLQYHAVRLAGFQGIVLISVLFGALHLTNLVVYDAFLAGGVGLMFGLVVQRTGSIWGVSVAHGVVNITLFLIAPHVLG